MSFRTTNIQQVNNFVEQIFSQMRELSKTRNEVSSGIKVSLASDDPGRAGTITKFQATLQRLERHGDRIGTSLSILETQESTLDSIQNIILRVREIGAGAANETIPASVRKTLSREVFQLRDQLVGLMNTRSQGSYIYGGADDDDPPVDLADPVTGGYNPPGDGVSPESMRYIFDDEEGTSVTKSVQITDSDTVRLNTYGGDVFKNALAAVERIGRSLAGYRTEPAAPALPDGTGDAYVQPDEYSEQTRDIIECLDLLDNASKNEIELERTSVGSRTNRLYQARDVLDLVKLNTEKARGTIQDADIFEAASRLSSLETSFQALLASGARINDLTILNFL